MGADVKSTFSQSEPSRLVVLPVDGSHPGQDVWPRDHPVTIQHPDVLGPAPALVG